MFQNEWMIFLFQRSIILQMPCKKLSQFSEGEIFAHTFFADIVIIYVSLLYVHDFMYQTLISNSPFYLQLAQLIVNAGGVAAVVDYVGDSKGNVRLPGIMMLGYVAAHSENLAMAVIVSKVCTKQIMEISMDRVSNSKKGQIY